MMIPISLIINDNKLNFYLAENIKLLLECFKYFNFCNPFASDDSYGKYDKVIEKISKNILDEIEDPLELEKYDGNSYLIDCSDCDVYCNNIEVTIKIIDNNEKCYASINDVTLEKIKMTLYLNSYFKIDINFLQGIILHELLHGYENYNKIKNRKLSIWDEISQEYNILYKKSKYIISNPISDIILLEYFFDFCERNPFIEEMIKDIEIILNKIQPNNIEYKIKFFIEHLIKIEMWEKYFIISKFISELDSYSDKTLESAYYKAIIEEQNIENKKKASEIKKEVKSKYEKINKKFIILIFKLYYDYLEKHQINVIL